MNEEMLKDILLHGDNAEYEKAFNELADGMSGEEVYALAVRLAKCVVADADRLAQQYSGNEFAE